MANKLIQLKDNAGGYYYPVSRKFHVGETYTLSAEYFASGVVTTATRIYFGLQLPYEIDENVSSITLEFDSMLVRTIGGELFSGASSDVSNVTCFSFDSATVGVRIDCPSSTFSSVTKYTPISVSLNKGLTLTFN